MKTYQISLIISLCAIATVFTSCGSSTPSHSYAAPKYNTYPEYSSSGVYTRQSASDAYYRPSVIPSVNTASAQTVSKSQSGNPLQSQGTTDRGKLQRLYQSANVNVHRTHLMERMLGVTLPH